MCAAEQQRKVMEIKGKSHMVFDWFTVGVVPSCKCSFASIGSLVALCAQTVL